MSGILDAFKLNGKVAIVTGSERGLGRGMAVALAQAGADIVGVTYVESAPETQAAVEAAGRKYVHVMANEQAVISPSWSIHAGVGSGPYSFIWGMAGENQTFDDMDVLGPDDLR